MSAPSNATSEAVIEDLISKINENTLPLSTMKERGRVVLGDFIRSEIVSYENKEHTLEKYKHTYELDIHGSLNGKIYLNLNSDIADYLSTVLFGESEEELRDEAMKETLNIFSGHMSAFLHEHDYDIDIGVPSASAHDIVTSKPKLKLLFRYMTNQQMMQFFMEID
ncbi:MAG: hypothetical protein OEZ22_01070 [Spirochaetia bacterium]|nr:hypothetical protein [Spirochaetia bacterium]